MACCLATLLVINEQTGWLRSDSVTVDPDRVIASVGIDFAVLCGPPDVTN